MPERLIKHFQWCYERYYYAILHQEYKIILIDGFQSTCASKINMTNIQWGLPPVNNQDLHIYT